MLPAPLVAPSALRPIVLNAALAAGLLMSMTTLGFMPARHTLAWLAGSLAAAFMVRATVALATRPKADPERGAIRVLGWSLVMGPATVPVVFLVQYTVIEPSLEAIPWAGAVMIFGAPIGLTLGAWFGIVLCVPVTLLIRARRHPSHDASDTLIFGVGLWLALIGLVCGLIDLGRFASPYAFFGSSNTIHVLILDAITSIFIGLGSLLALVATGRRTDRRRWVAKVAQGQVPGWRLVEHHGDRDELAELPRLGATLAGSDHLLHRCEDPGRGAYRHAETRWPVAWVPRAWIPRRLSAPRG